MQSKFVKEARVLYGQYLCAIITVYVYLILSTKIRKMYGVFSLIFVAVYIWFDYFIFLY